MSRRKILPRREVARYDSVDFASKQDIVFNDQKTMNFVSGVIMDMPSGLPRNYVTNNRNAYRGVETLSDLFAYPGGNSSYDLLMTELSGVFVTGTLKPGRYEQVSGIDPFYSSSSDAFKEVNHHEQGNFLDSFYATGSAGSIGEPGSFSTGLMNKTQIRMSFPVNQKTKMLSNSSSIYYLNINQGQWNIPATAQHDIVGPFEKFCFKTIDHAGGTIGGLATEDRFGFDCFGNVCISGSNDPHRYAINATNLIQSTDWVGKEINSINGVEISTGDYPKSITRNSDYDASSNETFELPIDRPFLIEKVVFEIPFMFGSSWFFDKTIIPQTTSSGNNYTYMGTAIEPPGYYVGFYDVGGPGITLSLMSQQPYGSLKIRDIVCHDLITHSDDLIKDIFCYATPDDHAPIIVLTSGQEDKKEAASVSYEYNADPNKRFFTGSVQIKSTAGISNGFLFKSFDEFYGMNTSDLISKFDIFMQNKFVKWNSNNTSVLSSNCAGRGLTGFEPSGNSIFGKEFSMIDPTRAVENIKNPYYVSSSTEREIFVTNMATKLASFPSEDTFLLYTQSFAGNKNSSPYLVYPGQKLILAASKTRPALKNIKVDFPDAGSLHVGRGTILSSSYFYDLKNAAGHDVQFNTGSINISFYGSYVKSNREFMT